MPLVRQSSTNPKRQADLLAWAAGVTLVVAMGWHAGATHPDPHQYINIRKAEHAARTAATNAAKSCPTSVAQSWAEVNRDQPEGFEVIAECLQPNPDGK